MSTNLDKMDEFENIDLDATRSEMDNDKDKSSLNSSIENLDETSELCASSSEHLNRILDQFTNDYKKYFQLNPTRQIEELNECIETLLTYMEEFYGIIEMIRNQNNICLDQLNLILMPKLEENEKLFGFIDKLERMVNHVSMQISLMENEVSQAEKMMGTKTSTVKKLFSFLSNDNASSLPLSSGQKPYVPPNIFNTEELLRM